MKILFGIKVAGFLIFAIPKANDGKTRNNIVPYVSFSLLSCKTRKNSVDWPSLLKFCTEHIRRVYRNLLLFRHWMCFSTLWFSPA